MANTQYIELLLKNQPIISSLKADLFIYGFYPKAYDDLLKAFNKRGDWVLNRLAAFELALWHANQQTPKDAKLCLKFLGKSITSHDGLDHKQRVAILTAECYRLLGKPKKGKKLLLSCMAEKPTADLLLAMANLEDEAKKYEWINKVFSDYKLAPIDYQRNYKTARYDALSVSAVKKNSAQENPKVSVVMPVYNAEASLHTALKAVVNQTWTNLEILIVDDYSTDNTLEIARKYQKRDQRIKIISAKANRGVYTARNIGAKRATGVYITCHDSDDWSHPQKIEKQVIYLIDNPEVVANTSQQARATNDLIFDRLGKPGVYMQPNISSLMFHRSRVLGRLGGWDSVRFGADSEFIKRIEFVFGEYSLKHLDTGPLSFPRLSNGSIVGSSASRLNGGYFTGARKEYFEAQSYYYRSSKHFKYNSLRTKRPFPVPEPMLPVPEPKDEHGYRHFDLVLLGDFRVKNNQNETAINFIKEFKKKDYRIGLVQMAQYGLSADSQVSDSVRAVIDGENIQMLIYGEKIQAAKLIICSPTVLSEYQKFIPVFKVDQLFILVDELPRKRNGKIDKKGLKRLRGHTLEYFNQNGIWYATNQEIHKELRQYKKLINVTDEEIKSKPTSVDWFSFF